MTKEQIEKAYGRYWEHVKVHVDDEGWCRTLNTGLIEMYFQINHGSVESQILPVRRWRPLKLSHYDKKR